MSISTKRVVCAVLCVATAGAAMAAGENAVLKDTPVIEFKTEDYRLMRERVREALRADAGSSQTLTWRNDANQASGSVTPLERETWQGLACRQVRISNTHRKNSAEGVYRFCEKPPGTWKLAGPVLGAR
jgi:surface antigen